MTAFLLFLVAVGQIAGGAGRPVSDADLKLLKDVSVQSGFTRTWIPMSKIGAASLGKPDAVYRLTLPGGSGKDDRLVEVEARRYGSLLLAYRVGSEAQR
jgi:hypothetical protein